MSTNDPAAKHHHSMANAWGIGDTSGDTRFIGDMQKLELKPGDIVVIKVDHQFSDEDIARIKAQAELVFKSNQVVVFSKGFDIGVLSPTKE
jgi:UDP-N-acetyl-D-mannosaminuronate dehydrogenase